MRSRSHRSLRDDQVRVIEFVDLVVAPPKRGLKRIKAEAKDAREEGPDKFGGFKENFARQIQREAQRLHAPGLTEAGEDHDGAHDE